MPNLSEYVSVKRRYSRSVNLERDFGIHDSIAGYIPTSRALDSIERFVNAITFGKSSRAWTLTGSYGTGKSAYANYLSAICANRKDENQQRAIEILKQTDRYQNLNKLINSRIQKCGLIRAVATAQREPIERTVVRALYNGATKFWQKKRGKRPYVLNELRLLYSKTESGSSIDNNQLIFLLDSLSRAAKTGILLVIDELGKNLEFSAKNQSLDDLYLLQQIAEMRSNRDGYNVFIFGLLHQSFIDYAHGLAAAQRNEWAKIQGRFEDIPFIESPAHMMRLIGQAIEQSNDLGFRSSVNKFARKWHQELSVYEISNHYTKKDLSSIYPLHPLTAIVLPILCTKFSQNDRTLFTFLASGEPGSFSTFLSHAISENGTFPTFKLYKVYDYFVESAGMSISARPHLQKWVEIQSRLSDATYLSPDLQLVLKTIGVLNLVSTTGTLRASRQTVALAMCNLPDDKKELKYWDDIINELLQKGFLIWRERVDELRIWEGSDFDIEKELSRQDVILNLSLADLLNEYAPLKPLVIQRHSYETGTLRYFERKYFDNIAKLISIECQSSDSDGIICYWVGNTTDLNIFKTTPVKTSNGRPILIITATELNSLIMSCREYVALTKVRKNATQLQSDGVARREIGQRIMYAQRLLNKSIARSFDINSGKMIAFNHSGIKAFKDWSEFQSFLSELCDIVYEKGPSLWNELINRRELTAQGATARNKLIAAMLDNASDPRLGIEGYGPEYSMFESILRKTGIYIKSDDGWCFSKPIKCDNGVYNVWRAIEDFCKSSKDAPVNLSKLYEIIEAPPYGAKRGPIPVLLMSVILLHNEYLSLYLDGTFLHVLGPEHFELLVKKPDRFSVKYFEVSGLRSEIFKELGKIISSKQTVTNSNLRNATILSIIKPLVTFIKRMPPYSVNTNRITTEAKSVKNALLNAIEPDRLLFSELPKACGLPEITSDNSKKVQLVKDFRIKLVQALSSIQEAYNTLINDCEKMIKRSFAIRIESKEFRDNIRYRAMNLASQAIEPRLKSFILAAIESDSTTKVWLESLMLIISNKPPQTWTDSDALLFETKLADIARRFANLEILQKEIAQPNKGIDARRITITYPDGNEIHKMLWIDRHEKKHIEEIADKIYEKYNLNEDSNLQQALAAAFLEKIYRKPEKNEGLIKEASNKELKIVD